MLRQESQDLLELLRGDLAPIHAKVLNLARQRPLEQGLQRRKPALQPQAHIAEQKRLRLDLDGVGFGAASFLEVASR